MTIYQVSTENKKEFFDFLLNSKYKDKQEYENNYKKLLGENLDVNFINTRIEFFNSFDYIIIDRDAFINEDRYCLQMMKSLISFMNKKTIPIFIWIDINEEYKKELIEAGIKNLIIANTLDEQKEEIAECFSEGGMKRYNTKWKTSGTENYEKYNFKENNIYCLQFLTTDNDLKVKSICLSLCEYLNKVGGTVGLIMPFCEDVEIESIAKLICAEKEDIYYKKDNIYITNNDELKNTFIEEKGINFLIRNLGFMNISKFEDIKDEIIDNEEIAWDKNIILCDPNILEIDTIRKIIENMNTKTYIVNSSNNYIKVDELQFENSIDKDFFCMLDKQMRIKRLDKQEDIIDIRTNRNFYNMLIEPQIVAQNIE